MALAHILRCQRFFWLGLRDRMRVSKMISGTLPIPASDAMMSVVPVKAIRAVAAAPPQTPRPPLPWLVLPWRRQLPPDPAFSQFVAQPMVVPMYCGLRLIDEFGHVNNAKYLELCELARWRQLSFLGIGTMMARLRVAFVVSDLSVTYQREIRPWSRVWLSTRILLPPSSTAFAGPLSSPLPGAAPSSDKRRLYIEHEIWSKDGRKLHAAITLAAALIGPVKYEQELARRYDPTAAAAAAAPPHAPAGTRARQRTTLNCEHVLADALDLSSVAELRKLFESAEHICTPAVGDGDAAAAAKSDEMPDQESAARQERITGLARIWRTTRNQLRHTSFISSPPPP
ncbi:Thioesterase-like superfamily/Thioesterase superfamily [Leishmania donovani]|uniref:Thioesterase-like_superfamily/Thioesterase_superf amily_putative/Pfam:PF13279/Pfam:PF03061 n=2 Tax=Leishmania donovani TaxID=5661 RepID=A0A6J8FH30_LEIDO|nr:Thioesterase-like superfamily/Thioesterase superfamily [Leishmania donovani]VDZ45647.1 Thioesterase-like_superfamily/Thioesterase_superfamily_putative/Pfam:PF13279/Pfam:PF03061 [Leishmania donovani]